MTTTNTETHDRLMAAATFVLAFYDHAASFTDAPSWDATARAMGAMAVWQAITGIEDPDEAVAVARRLVEPT